MKYITTPFIKFFDFNGRSTRREFWVFYFFIMLINVLLLSVLKISGGSERILSVCSLISIVAIGFRRVNDTGANRFLFLIPILNLILACFPTDFFKKL